MASAQPNQSLIDGLACLQLLAGSRQAMGSREVARELTLEPTRANRLLKTLAHQGLLEQDDKRKYRVGPGIHVLAALSMFGSGLLQRARAPLERLGRHGHIVALGVLWRQHVTYLYHAEPGMAFAQAVGRIGLYPAQDSSIGIAVLARSAKLSELPAAWREPVRDARQRGHALLSQHARHASVAVALPGAGRSAVALSGDIPQAELPALVQELHDVAASLADAP